jgi:hypothetical protein
MNDEQRAVMPQPPSPLGATLVAELNRVVRAVSRGLVAAAYWILGIAWAFALSSILLFAIAAKDWHEYFEILGSGICISTASFAIGCLTGFLFGIPRTPHAGEVSPGEKMPFQPNTNLEQISDWLTKILVGVGLTQLSKIPGKLWNLAQTLSAAMGEFPSSPSFVLALLGFFLTAGFFAGYLWTRIYFRRALIYAERPDWISRTEVDQKLEENAAFSSAISAAGEALALPATDAKRMSRLRDASLALESASGFLHVRSAGILLGRLYREMREFDKAIDALTRCLALRQAQGAPENTDDADLYFNRACYHNLKSRAETAVDRKSFSKRNAVEDLRRSFRLSTANVEDAKNDEDLKDIVDLAIKPILGEPSGS